MGTPEKVKKNVVHDMEVLSSRRHSTYYAMYELYAEYEYEYYKMILRGLKDNPGCRDIRYRRSDIAPTRTNTRVRDLAAVRVFHVCCKIPVN